MPRIVACGSVHVDIFADADVPFTEGADVMGNFMVAVGGTAFNVAVSLHAMRVPIRFVSALPHGSLLSRIILSKLHQLNLPYRVVKKENLKEPAFLAVREKGDLKVAVTSTCVDMELVEDNLFALIKESESEAHAVFLDCNLSETLIERVNREISLPMYLHCVSEVKALRVLSVVLPEKVKFIFLNENEKKKLLSYTGCNNLIDIHPCNWVVTRGELGSEVILSDGSVLSYPPPELSKVRAYSGLGDAFTAGFIYGYEKNGTIDGAVESANRFVAYKAPYLHASFAPVSLSDAEMEFYRDRLTGVLSRSFLEDERDYVNYTYGRPFTVIMVDVDNFKKINDTYGHQVGDEVLKVVAERITKNVRTNDLVVRYGGEEFLVILERGTGKRIAGIIAERIRFQLEKEPIASVGVTASFGVASAHDLDEAILQADKALYLSKNRGKNLVTVV